MPAACGIFTDAEIERMKILSGNKVIAVRCVCGWQGKSSELVKRHTTHQCPACSRVFSPYP